MLCLRSVSVEVQHPVEGHRHPVLHDIHVTLHPGQGVALVGPNGAGKSTLLLAAAGALPLKHGSITVGDLNVDSTAKSRRRLRELIGVALQFPERGFFARNVREEISFTCARLGWSPRQQDEAVANALDHVGLSLDFLERSLYELSGGEKRLVALAAALAHRPKVLLLDEPEVGLDHRGVHRIKTMVHRFTQEGGAAFVVTHDLEGALTWAHRLLVLKNGRLTADIDVHELTSKGRWPEISSWLWDRGAFGMAHTNFRRRDIELPSPYEHPTEFYNAVKTLLERRSP